jgi:hypothetical protein
MGWGRDAGLEKRDPLQLLRRQLGAEIVDCLLQCLATASTRDSIGGDTLGQLEWRAGALGFVRGLAGAVGLGGVWRFQHRDHCIGEVAPGVELGCADADLDLEARELLGDVRARPLMRTGPMRGRSL